MPPRMLEREGRQDDGGGDEESQAAGSDRRRLVRGVSDVSMAVTLLVPRRFVKRPGAAQNTYLTATKPSTSTTTNTVVTSVRRFSMNSRIGSPKK